MADALSGCVAITGASGFIGRAVLPVLCADPHVTAIRILGRRRVSAGPRCTWAPFDLASGTVPNLAGVDTVIHLAGEKRDAARMRAVNADGTRRLLDASRSAGVARFVHLSSVGVYGARHDGGRVTEASAHTPRDDYERSKDEAEHAVREFGRESAAAVFVLQPSNVLGTSPDGPFPLLGFARAIRRGMFAYVGSPAAMLNYVAVEDVAYAVAAAAVHPGTGGVFILNTPIRLDTAVALLADGMGMRSPTRVMPVAIAMAMATGMDVAATMMGRSLPFSRARVRELTGSTVYDGDAARMLFSGDYPVGIHRALQNLVATYRDAHALSR